MDVRLAILAATFVLVLFALVYLARSVSRLKQTEPNSLADFEPSSWPMLKPAPPEIVEAARSDAFAEPTGGMVAVLNQPLRTGAWKPVEEGVVGGHGLRPSADYWDALIEEQSVLVSRRTVVPAKVRTPQVTAVAPADEPVDWLDTLIDELDAGKPAPAPELPQPEPVVPKPAPTPEPPRPEPVVPTPVPAPAEPRPQTVVRTVEPVRQPVSVAPPIPVPPLIERPRATVSVIATPASDRTEIASNGSTLPSPNEAISVHPIPPSLPASAPSHGPSGDEIPDIVLVAPVEMWFGESRVGVKQGSRTYELLQKYARALLDDLKRSKADSRSGQG
ncbi:MAG: hypothetical protein Q8K99_07670 [Actinomycetota bacterium]|nr:hypothetical protein [Actinomycetota bacterium]